MRPGEGMGSAEIWHGKGPGRDGMRGRSTVRADVIETRTKPQKQHWLLFINATAPLFLIYFGWEPSKCFSRGTF